MRKVRSNQTKSTVVPVDAQVIDSIKSLALEPASVPAQDFFIELDALTGADGCSDLREVCKEFGDSQRNKVQSLVSSLDGSLRGLAAELESVLQTSDKTISEAEGSTKRLKRARSAENIDEIKTLIQAEVATLTKMIDKHKVQAEILRVQYLTELAKMRSRLEEAQEAASIDPLTKLPNRRIHSLSLLSSIEGASPTVSHALALLDLDGFKWINDRYGHAAGDEALMQFSNALYRVFGEECFVARLGGDEFTVIAPYSALKLRKELETFRETMSAVRIDIGPARVRTMPSYGCVPIIVGSRPETLMADVDAKMYAFKREHRPKKAA